jgi:hypothetical protein
VFVNTYLLVFLSEDEVCIISDFSLCDKKLKYSV